MEDSMPPTSDRTELAKTLASISNLLPDLFAVFTADKLALVQINTSGKKLLDPSGTRPFDKVALTDIIGINDIDRFRREVHAQALVLGSWKGVLVLRDFLGSEFTRDVKLLEIPAMSQEGGRCLCLHASPTTQKNAGNDLVTDPDMLNALMATSPNAIYFKDPASRYLRISRALATKCGLADPRDAIGKTDFDYFTVEHAAPAFEDEQRIQKTNQPLIDHEEKETFDDGRVAWVSTAKFPFYNREGTLIGTYGISRDITARKVAEERLRMLSRAVEESPAAIFITDKRGKIEYVNPYFEKITGYSAAEAVGQNPRILKSGHQPPEFYQEMWETISEGREWGGEIQNLRKNGELYWERATISAIRDEKGQITHYVTVNEDITERKQAEAQHQEEEAQSQLAQKLQSVGMLAAGVAHEINTPTQYITDNTRFLTDTINQLFKVIACYRAHFASRPECAENFKEVAAVEKENELEYLLVEIPRSLEQSLEGLGRISRIVSSLKEFSHPNSEAKTGADLNKAIETTVAVSRHEWKYVADVLTELDPKLPQVECILDEFNQAVLNLVINATHAIDDAIKKHGAKRGTITIRTRQEPGWVVTEVEDTGTGIPPEVRDKIFDPFFTTKGIGKGTGQGLAIVQAVIVKGHGGRVDFTTEMGKGTTFRMYLPLSQSHPSRAGIPTVAKP
jgi:PAS domain S-box-containing protein